MRFRLLAADGVFLVFVLVGLSVNNLVCLLWYLPGHTASSLSESLKDFGAGGDWSARRVGHTFLIERRHLTTQRSDADKDTGTISAERRHRYYYCSCVGHTSADIFQTTSSWNRTGSTCRLTSTKTICSLRGASYGRQGDIFGKIVSLSRRGNSVHTLHRAGVLP